uniref:Uncharacterized protein n=1 Tax=Wuchereria bancrofti TaxID=6293 RepID=A0A1I8ELL4_WUCBA
MNRNEKGPTTSEHRECHFTTHPQLVVHMMRKDELDSDLNRSIKRGEGGSKGKRKGKNGPSSSIRSSTGPRRCHRQPLNLSVTVRTIFCFSFASAQLVAIFRPLAIETCHDTGADDHFSTNEKHSLLLLPGIVIE